MTPLGRRLIAKIAAEGPISLAEYMAHCLLDGADGYYATRHPIGAAGDFTTAPEISQMFGELLGLWIAQCWMDQGRPSPFIVAELGPGRGTLMADILRTLSAAVPACIAAAEVHLIEVSPTLRSLQQDALAKWKVTWHADIADLPEGPLFLIANEFFDALPIRQFQRTAPGWSERKIGLLGTGLGLCLVAGQSAPAILSGRLDDTAEGDVVEICPTAPLIAGEIGRRIAGSGGVALVIDYGGWHSLGDTFQAVAAHHPVDPFIAPGQADLTAHVDFETIARAFRSAGAATTPMVFQGIFLERLGISARAARLSSGLTGLNLANHVAAHRRLTHPAEMGEVFKVIACHPARLPPPPGLDAL